VTNLRDSIRIPDTNFRDSIRIPDNDDVVFTCLL